jgi:hypothetical protein
MKRLALLASAIALCAATTAQAAEPPCLTPAEFTALSSYALPSAIRGAASRCAGTLPAGAYLRTSGETLARKYDTRKAAAWPGARAAFLRVGTAMSPQTAELFKGMPAATLQPIVDTMLTSMVGQKLPLERCAALDRLVMLVSPLPPENTAELFGLAAGLYAQDGRAKLGQFSVCKTAN